MGQATSGLLIGILGGIVGLILLFRAMTRTKFWMDLTSPSVQGRDEGYTTTLGWENLVGEYGITDTDLHPSGWIKINDQRIFAVSEGAFIDNKTSVTVLSVDGNRVVVREKSD